MAEFDYLGAKQAGASDEEIQSFLKANGTNFDLIGAKQAGATDDEISTFLKSQPVKKKEVSKPTTQVSSNGTTKTSQSSYNLDLSLPKINPNPNNIALPGLGQPLNAKDNILGKGTVINKDLPKSGDINKIKSTSLADLSPEQAKEFFFGENFIDGTKMNDTKGWEKWKIEHEKYLKENEAKTNPYAVDITDNSADATKTQVKQQAQIQNDVDTGKLDENNIATYRGASKVFNDKAIEVTGKNDAKSLIDYGKVAGVDDDLVNRLDDGDKTLFQNQEQLKNLYEQRDILSKSDEQTQKSNLTEINKSIAEIEKNNALLYTKRNSDIDAQILDLQKQLNSGVKTINVSTGNGTLAGQDGLESGATEQQTISLNDNEKTLLKNQIQSLQKRKGAYLQDATNPKEVYKELSPKLKMYEDKNIIPKDASVIDKLKIYYGVKLTQLNELKKRSDIENDYNLGSFGNALVQSVKQRFVDDKTTKSINEIETELNSIAPIIAINADPNAKKKGFFSTLGNSVVDNLTQTTNLNQTSQEKALAVSNAMQKVGVELSKDRIEELNTQIQNKDFGQRKEKNADMLGSTTAFMVDFGVTSLIGEGILSGAAKLAKLALSPKAVVALNVGKTALEETKIGRLAINVAEEGVKYEIVGDINRVIENDATFSQGASGALGSKLGEKTAERLAMFLGKSASPFVKLVFDTLGRTGVELFEETAQNTDQLISEITGKDNFVTGAIELFKDSAKGKQFVDSIKKQYGNIDDDVDFVLQLAAMSTAFNVGKFGSYFKDLALQKRNELSETEKEQYDVIVHDMQSEVKDVAEKTVSEISDAEKKSPEEVAKTLVTGESTAKDGSSTITKVETEIANKINKGQELTAEETDYYNAKKDSIDKLVTVNKSPIVPINETVEVEKKEIVLPPPTPQVVAPAELDEQQITEQLNEVLNDKTTPTPLVNTEQEQNISERLPSEYQNNQGVQQINGIGQDVSNESEVPQIEQEQEAGSVGVGGDVENALEKELNELGQKQLTKGFNKLSEATKPEQIATAIINIEQNKNQKTKLSKEQEQKLSEAKAKLKEQGYEIIDYNIVRNGENTIVQAVDFYDNEKDILTEEQANAIESKINTLEKRGEEVNVNNLPSPVSRTIKPLIKKDGKMIQAAEVNTLVFESVEQAKEAIRKSKEAGYKKPNAADKIKSKAAEQSLKETTNAESKNLSTKTEEITPQKAIEVDRNVDSIAILDEIKAKNLTHVRGKNMGENQSLGTFISTEKGNRYETADNKAESVEVDIKNPLVVENDLGLVGKRTEILNNNKDQFTKEDTVDYQELPNGKITLDDLNDAGIKKLAKLTTEKLQADGYDGIYFKESKTQEGELVVFDKEKVKFKEQTPIADEKPKLKAKEKQDLVKSLNKEQVKEFIKLKTPQEKESYLINLRDKEQKLKNDKHDRLVSLMREYNETPSNRTTRKQEIRQSMLKLSSDLGYSIKAKEGDKLEVLNSNGKLIRKINIPTDEKPATAENIEKVKELTHWFNWNGNDLDFHIDAVKLGLTWQNIRTALADINAGKTESTNINRVANAINEYGNMESLPLVRGFGGNYERLDVTGDDLFWAQKVNEATELLSGYEYNEAEREQALKDLSETDEKEFEQYSDLYSKFVNQDGTLNWEEALKYEQANKTTTDESAKGQGSSNDIGDGKNSQQLQKENRSEAEIKSELKIKEAELKKLEEKQSQLNKQLEQNLKENQLDLLQGAKPQAMFDDKVEQQKIAEKSKSDIENKRKEIAKLNEELDNINQGEIPFQSTDKKFTTISQSKFNQLLDKLKKAFPNVKVELFGKSDFDNARKELEKRGIVVTDTKTKDGTIYGFKTPDGKVFLNSDAINANTPIHEFGHVWQSVFPNEFAKGISLLVQSPQGRELINEIRKNPAYKGKSITEIQAEALVTAIGNKGETIFNSNPTLYNKFKQWLNDLFAKIGDKLGIINLSPDDKFDMFTKKVVGELLGGKVLDSKVGTEKSTEKTITFQGQNIKVKEINGGAEVVNGFYSPLEKIINETKFEKLPAKQWVDKFAKGEEAKWTGLTDWLNQQQGSVSKSDIQQYLKDNRIQVVEVVKGEDMPNYKLEVEPPTELGADRMDLLGDLGKAGNLDNPRFRDYLNKKYGKNGNKIYDWLVDNATVEGTYSKDTKFSQYQLEGKKENYKEVLVTMPQKKTKKPYEQWLKENFYGEDRKEARDLYAQQIDSKDPNFKSSHFDEPNILVHLRMNTRTDAEGNKVLFLEEVQSDWGQKGKKEGFIPEKITNKNFIDYRTELYDKYNVEKLVDLRKVAKQDELAMLETLFANENDTKNLSTPTAPFVTDTNAWTKLALKVALKEAVKQGADKIAWTTGEQQNDRYDLSKSVDYVKNSGKTPNGDTYIDISLPSGLLNLHVNEKGIVTKQLGSMGILDAEGKRLDDIIGKDIAERILSSETNTKLEGEGLKVGGKGMKGFYGSPTEGSLGIVGNVAKSLFKQEPKTVKFDLGAEQDNWVVKEDPEMRGEWLVYDNKNKKIIQRFFNKNDALNFGQDKNVMSTQHSIDITPEMKAMVEFGQPLFQFKPDELTKKVQELRDYELTDNEIRDYLLEAGNTKQQIDDALGVKEVGENKDETKKELSDSKQRVAERIVLGNSTLNAVKEHIVQQGYDKSDYDSKQIFKDIDELINKFGIEKAESFIDKIGDVGLSEPHKVVLQHKIAEYYGNKALSDETLTEEERKEAMFKSAQLFLDLSQQRTDAGRGNAILAQIYLESDIYFTLPMFENKMNAIGAQLSGAEKIELENLQNEIKELRKENIKLQELAKKEAEQQIVDDITTHLLVDDLIIDSKIKDDLEVKNAKSILAKGFEDIARMLSSIAMAQQVDKVKFKDTILDMTKATMTISKIGVKKALKSVIKAIKNANQNIDEKLLEDAEKHVLSQIKDTDTGIKKKNKEGISKDELIELIDQGADTMEKMVEAIRNKYYDGDKSISDKQIRDEITNYGNSIRQSQTQVEEKLSEIKSLMLLQSKLEDAENNIAPKKTGFIRDKDKIAVREKRRELAEAMKKLTVTLSEDDIAGLNERKLTQIANKIEEVQKVLDGYEKIKNKANFDYNDAVKKKQQELDDLMSSQKALLHYAKENLTNLVAKYQDKLDKKQYSKNPTLNKLSITDSEYQKLKNQLEAKKEQLKSERDNFRNNNADYLLENRQKQIDRQIVEIDNLLAGIKVRKTSEQIKAEKDRKAGVINSSTNQTALDKLKENQKVLEAKKEQWERKVIQKEVEIEKAKQTWLQKLGINAMSISRTLTLGFTDIGWLGVQGGYFARTKPHLFAKALKESFKGKLSEEAFNQWKRDLKSNPFYETMIKAGLRIPSQSLRDDIFEQEFRESGFTKLLGKNEVTDIVNKNARLSVKFLANLRIQVFQKMYNGLTDSQKADKEVLEKLADYVNSRSGAGQVIGEDNKRGLNKWWGLLTSARNTSAMLQQTYIGMLYGLYKNYDPKKPLSNQPVLRRQIINDTINQAVLFSGLYLSYLVANGLSGDDDEWNVETSPFSTNFLKLKNKEGDRSYFDMGGMTALNVATLRLLTTITNAFGTDIDNFKDYKGEYSKVGLKDFSSKTGLQILSESIFNRTLSLLAPIKNPFTAKSDKDGNYSMYGKTYTPTEFKLKMLMDMFIPMNLPNIYNDITDKDVNALNAIVNTVLNVIGISNQNQKYDKPEDSTSPQVNSVPVKSTPVSSMPIVPRPVK